MLYRVHKASWFLFTIISYHTYLSLDSACGFLEINVFQKRMLVFFNFFDHLESYFLTWWRSVVYFFHFIRTWYAGHHLLKPIATSNALFTINQFFLYFLNFSLLCIDLSVIFAVWAEHIQKCVIKVLDVETKFFYALDLVVLLRIFVCFIALGLIVF
jgi:hypothetical protein